MCPHGARPCRYMPPPAWDDLKAFARVDPPEHDVVVIAHAMLALDGVTLAAVGDH